MEISEYTKAFPDEHVWRVKASNIGLLKEVMLQFEEKSSHSLAGPFQGGFAYVRVTNTKLIPSYGLKSLESLKLLWRYSTRHFNETKVTFKGPAKDEQHLQRRLQSLKEPALKAWNASVEKFQPECPTKESPVEVFVAGNDDASWSKFFATEEEGLEELTYLLGQQPIDITRDIYNRGYVFTN